MKVEAESKPVRRNRSRSKTLPKVEVEEEAKSQSVAEAVEEVEAGVRAKVQEELKWTHNQMQKNAPEVEEEAHTEVKVAAETPANVEVA